MSVRAVIVSLFSLLAMYWISKPANVNGSICQKKYLADDVLEQKTFPSIIFYENGLQTQHAKCGRINFRHGINPPKETPSYVFGVCAKEGDILVGPVEYRKGVEEAVVTEGGI